jgi:hypothetical protein
MNWDAVAAIAELLSAIGVIGSLIYVASQVRERTVASKVESKLRRGFFSGVSKIYRHFGLTENRNSFKHISY